MKPISKTLLPVLLLLTLSPAPVFSAPPSHDMSGMSEEEMKNMDGGNMSMDGMFMGDRPPGNAAMGKQLAGKLCASCHGPAGINQSDEYPLLAGQDEAYLFGALYAYRCKSRKSDVMNGMAASLTDQNMADLAAYFMNSEVQP